MHSDVFGEFYSLVQNVGDLAPGETLTVTIDGLIDYSFDAGNLPVGIANLDVVVYDEGEAVFLELLQYYFRGKGRLV